MAAFASTWTSFDGREYKVCDEEEFFLILSDHGILAEFPDLAEKYVNFHENALRTIEPQPQENAVTCPNEKNDGSPEENEQTNDASMSNRSSRLTDQQHCSQLRPFVQLSDCQVKVCHDEVSTSAFPTSSDLPLIVEAPSWSCAECKRLFCSERALKIHNSHKHKVQAALVVGNHSSAIVTRRSSTRELSSAASSVQIDGKPHRRQTKFSCNECGKKSLSRAAAENHYESVHLKRKPLACDICGRKFALSSNLNRHVKAVHLKMKPYVCRACGRKFTFRSYLEDHVAKAHKYDGLAL